MHNDSKSFRETHWSFSVVVMFHESSMSSHLMCALSTENITYSMDLASICIWSSYCLEFLLKQFYKKVYVAQRNSRNLPISTWIRGKRMKHKISIEKNSTVILNLARIKLSLIIYLAQKLPPKWLCSAEIEWKPLFMRRPSSCWSQDACFVLWF